MLLNRNLPVEVIVCDNCSTDNTAEVVTGFNQRGLPVKYFRNSENMGPDLNILRAYQEASGKYVLCLGDDDLLISDAVNKLLSIITQHEAGVIFLNSYAFQESVEKERPARHRVGYRVINSSVQFLSQVNYFITFISGNVVNKQYFDYEYSSRFKHTNLIQVSFILPAILQAPQNIFVDELLLAVQADNSGGYNLFKVFGCNLNNIASQVLQDHQRANLNNTIKRPLLFDFFPKWLATIRKRQPAFQLDEAIQSEFDKIYGGLVYYHFTRQLFSKEVPAARLVLKMVYITTRLKLRMSKIFQSTHPFASIS